MSDPHVDDSGADEIGARYEAFLDLIQSAQDPARRADAARTADMPVLPPANMPRPREARP